jgi:hypothetical protein
LTLLALLIGSFSMAISRYDERKNHEELEANAIGTEFMRAGLLPENEAAASAQALCDAFSSATGHHCRFRVVRDPEGAL